MYIPLMRTMAPTGKNRAERVTQRRFHTLIPRVTERVNRPKEAVKFSVFDCNFAFLTKKTDTREDVRLLLFFSTTPKRVERAGFLGLRNLRNRSILKRM